MLEGSGIPFKGLVKKKKYFFYKNRFWSFKHNFKECFRLYMLFCKESSQKKIAKTKYWKKVLVCKKNILQWT